MIERIQTERLPIRIDANKGGSEILGRMEKSGLFVFHGTRPVDFDMFEPRHPGKNQIHKVPFLYTTPSSMLARNFALVANRGGKVTSCEHLSEDRKSIRITMGANQEAIDAASVGYNSGDVAVFLRSDFHAVRSFTLRGRAGELATDKPTIPFMYSPRY